MLGLVKKSETAGDLAGRINRLPSGNILCHGDFHPYNIILTPEQKRVSVDCANRCRAPKEYDVARTCFLLKTAALEEPAAGLYLEKMGLAYPDIQDYLEVLELPRAWFREWEPGRRAWAGRPLGRARRRLPVKSLIRLTDYTREEISEALDQEEDRWNLCGYRNNWAGLLIAICRTS